MTQSLPERQAVHRSPPQSKHATPSAGNWIAAINALLACARGETASVSAEHEAIIRGSPLEGWIPERTDLTRLELAVNAVANAMRHSSKALNLSNLDSAFGYPGEHWSELKRLAVQFVQRNPAPISAPRPQSALAPKGTAKRKPPNAPLLAKNKQATPVASPKVVPRAQSLPATDWGSMRQFYVQRGEHVIIYMDEAWPSREFGVIAGLVWRGERPKAEILPVVRQHLRSCFGKSTGQEPLDKWPEAVRKAVAALENAHERCLPFAFRFVPPEGKTPEEVYEQMVYDALLLLLGWILLRKGEPGTPPVRVTVICEAIGAEFHDGQLRTSRFQGVLEHAGRSDRDRFADYDIKRVEWRKKSTEAPETFSEDETERQGYLGYADLLGYLTFELENSKAAEAAAIFNVRKLPTYLEISADTVFMLMTLERASGRELGPAIDFLTANRLHVGGEINNVVTHSVVQHLKARIEKEPRLRDDLLELLNERYMAKDRDLRKLDAQFSIVMLLVGDLPESAPTRLKLLELASRLQRANHFGDPHAVLKLEGELEVLRQKALGNGLHDEVAHVELNLAVRARDRFQPDVGARYAQRLIAEGDRYSYLSRAKVHSSLGQDLAMLGDNAGARREFDAALALLNQAELGERERQKEWDQTAIYRAIAAMDSGATDAVALVEEILAEAGLGNLTEAAVKLAADSSTEHAYRHHLLLRLLYARPDLSASRDAYLAAMKPDVRVQHPYELICLYRALMIHGGGDAKAHLRRGIEIAMANSHGATLRAIAAMIATAGWALLLDPEFRDQGRRFILGEPESLVPVKPLDDLLPTAQPMIAAWLEILMRDIPSEADVNRALGQLKFNYR